MKVKQVYGGGKSIEGIFAYYEAVKELHSQIDDVTIVFLACGTGTTLTGICAGMQKYFPHAKVYGISVARTWEQEKPVLIDNMKALNSYLGTDYDFFNLSFYDDFLCGGYAQTSGEELRIIQESISKEGMILDPTYSGKAFYGMSKILDKKDLKEGKVLFWNTGGLINLLSQQNSFIL